MSLFGVGVLPGSDRLADAIAETGDLLDTCVIGWDSINEPGEGFLGIPNLNDFPPSQDFKKGPSPTPIQSFNLGVGRSQKDVEVWDFNSLGPKKTGKTDLTPVDGQGCWLTKKEADDAANFFGWKLDYDFWGDEPDSTASGDIWAAHGVWDRHSGKILESSYFHHPTKNPKEEYDFTSNFWVAHWAKYLKRIRESHPQAISFCNPPVFAKSPSLDPEIHQGRMCLSAHFYDGMTLLGKRRHLYNAVSKRQPNPFSPSEYQMTPFTELTDITVGVLFFPGCCRGNERHPKSVPGAKIW